jgi:uncharacterized protein YfaQ (DUF2300 family)
MRSSTCSRPTQRPTGSVSGGSGDKPKNQRFGPCLNFAVPGSTTSRVRLARTESALDALTGYPKSKANGTFYVDLFGLSNALFTKEPRGLGTILNDD